MKHTALGKGNSRLSPSWTKLGPKSRRRGVSRCALCVTNAEPDLPLPKVYRILPDRVATKCNHLRVVDESGEDYLYPEQCFVLIELLQKAESALSVPT